MKNPKRVESYVPVAAFYEGKQELAGRPFSDRFAVLDAERNFCALAMRSERPAGTVLHPAENRAFLREATESGKNVLAAAESGAVVLFGRASVSGLTPAWFPAGSFCEFAGIPARVGRADLLFSPLAQSMVGSAGKSLRGREEIFRQFAGELIRCDSILNGLSTDFRLRCAEIAALAGCRADVRELPVGDFPVAEADRRLWTVFLCCLFLSLRGADAKGPTFRMRELGRQTLITGMEYRSNRDSERSDPARFAFLDHPAFRRIQSERTENGYRLSFALTRSAGQSLRAMSRALWVTVGLELVS